MPAYLDLTARHLTALPPPSRARRYPRNDLDAPVLGIDLLCFGGAKLLAVVDCQPLQPKGDAEFRPSTCPSFEKIRAAYPSLQGKMSSRFYDEDTFFSDAMLYGRYEDAAPVATDVLPALKEYMSAYLAMIGRTERSEGHDEVARVVSQQKEYDQYSADHDPAHALFTSYFGADWADEYVHDFLFDMSERKEKEAVKEVAVAAGAGGRATGGGNPFAAAGGGNPFASAGKGNPFAPQNQQQPRVAPVAAEPEGAQR